MMLSLKCHEQVQQSTFWVPHAKESDEGKTKLRSQLVAKSPRKQVSCFFSGRSLSHPVLFPLFHFEEPDSLKNTFKRSENSMALKRRREKLKAVSAHAESFQLLA